MATLDVLTEDWTLWHVVLVGPQGRRWPVKVRCLSQAEAERKALLHRPRWSVARDEYGNPLVWREGVGK